MFKLCFINFFESLFVHWTWFTIGRSCSWRMLWYQSLFIAVFKDKSLKEQKTDIIQDVQWLDCKELGKNFVDGAPNRCPLTEVLCHANCLASWDQSHVGLLLIEESRNGIKTSYKSNMDQFWFHGQMAIPTRTCGQSSKRIDRHCRYQVFT